MWRVKKELEPRGRNLQRAASRSEFYSRNRGVVGTHCMRAMRPLRSKRYSTPADGLEANCPVPEETMKYNIVYRSVSECIARVCRSWVYLPTLKSISIQRINFWWGVLIVIFREDPKTAARAAAIER